MYKLSPSDFAYLYQDCKHCYYRKIKQGVILPTMPMPGIFGAINSRLQNLLIGKPLRELSANMPEGIVESQEVHIQSKSVNGHNFYLKGKYDLLVKQADGTYLIVDFKISQADEEKVTKYQTQLWSYKYMLEHPASGKPITISKMGLIIMYPDRTAFHKGEAMLTFPPKWFEVKYDEPAFNAFAQDLEDLLAGPLPAESESCLWCQYRRLGE